MHDLGKLWTIWLDHNQINQSRYMVELSSHDDGWSASNPEKYEHLLRSQDLQCCRSVYKAGCRRG